MSVVSPSSAVKSVAQFLRNLVSFNFLQSVLATWWKHEFVKWSRHVVCGNEVVLEKICNICEAVFFRIRNIRMSAALNLYLAFALLTVIPKSELGV